MNADDRLTRAIGPWSLGANAVNLSVGAGIFALPAAVAGILGPAAILAYLVCGLAIALVLTCFAELGTRVTRSGGAVAYIEDSFGPMAGFVAWVVFTLGFCAAADAAVGANPDRRRLRCRARSGAGRGPGGGAGRGLRRARGGEYRRRPRRRQAGRRRDGRQAAAAAPHRRGRRAGRERGAICGSTAGPQSARSARRRSSCSSRSPARSAR